MKIQDVPSFEFEQPMWEKDTYVIGIDEVGRGCIAGPITVAGVCIGKLNKQQQSEWLELGLHDSKKLTEKKRNSLQPIIYEKSLCYSIHSSDVSIINRDGIVSAFYQAVYRIIRDIRQTIPSHKKIIAFIDGFNVPELPIEQQAIIKGDAKSISIAAASIIAKVHRDTHMTKLNENAAYEPYCWNVNKGYGTLKHREAIKAYGASNLHRTLFIRNIVGTI